MSKRVALPPILNTLRQFAGQTRYLAIPKAFIKFAGGLEVGLVFGQLLFQSDKGKRTDGWIAKADKDIAEELLLTTYAIRKSRKHLKKLGILETKLMRWNGSPTTHYRFKWDVLAKLWAAFLEDSQMDFAKTKKRIDENAKSITVNNTVNGDIAQKKDNRGEHMRVFWRLRELCGITDASTKATQGQLHRTAKALRGAGATPGLIDEFKQWWAKHNWKGRKGELPELTAVREQWGAFLKWKASCEQVEYID